MTFKVDKHRNWFIWDKKEGRILEEGDAKACENFLFSFLRLLLELCGKRVAYFYRQLKTSSQVMKTEGTRPVIMFSFSETVPELAYGWLEGEVNPAVVAVMISRGRTLSVPIWICRYRCSWMSLC